MFRSEGIVTWIRFSNGPIQSFLDPKWETSIVLPCYGPGYSGQQPLETSDCAGALQTNILKARLILLEIERVKHRKIVSPLDGDVRQLDELLAAIHGDLSDNSISSPAVITLQGLWKMAIQIEVAQYEATFKVSWLRLDREFRTEIIEPLKIMLGNVVQEKKSIPDYISLIAPVSRIAEEARKVGLDRAGQYEKAWSRLKFSQDWLEAERIDNRISHLEEEAESFGFVKRTDQGWKDLKGYDRYSHLGKAEKLIYYLEGYIQKANSSTIST